MRRLFAHRDARLLLAGQTLSFFGDRALYLALGVWVKALTGSNAAAGLIFFVLALPALGAPFAGLVVDRVRRRPLMIGVNLAIAAALLLLLLVHGRGDVWLIYLVTLLYGVAAVFLDSAQSALLTVMLPEELLGDANAALQSVSEGCRLIAPLAGAALFAAVGGGAVAILDAATFVAAAACLAGLALHEPRPAPRETQFREQVGAGLAHVRRTPALRRIIGTTGLLLLVFGFTETLIFAVVAALHHPPSFLGVLLSLQGVGAVAGGLTAAPLVRRIGDGRLVGIGALLAAVGTASLADGTLLLALPGIAVAGAGISWLVVAFGTAIQRRTPADLQGRVYSAATVVLAVPQTLSIAAGAVLSTVVDYRLLLGVVTAVCVAGGAYLVTSTFSAPAEDVAAAERRRARPAELVLDGA